MIVAVFPVLPMDMSADHVIDVPVVRNGGMLAADAVHVVARMRAARVCRVATDQVGFAELMLVDVVAVRMMEVGIVHVIDVIVVPDGQMAAVFPVLMVVPIVDVRFQGYSLRRRNAQVERVQTFAPARPLSSARRYDEVTHGSRSQTSGFHAYLA
ncbi:MAG: hypothetical protein NVS3B16_26410 [Vulcanimicrobiaceae bacterium]